MAIRQVADNKSSKDGRKWYFYVSVLLPEGNRKLYTSKLFMTKKEASIAEKEFILGIEKKQINISDMTFMELFNEFYEYKKDKVKMTTLRTYRHNIIALKEFHNLKIKDINLTHYLNWRRRIVNLDLADKTKNGYYKLLKTILNYGTKWHDFNFAPLYAKMEKFHNPNIIPREMEFYTWEEFQQFFSVIDELKWKCIFGILYYCGLRRGELRGLTWDNIDFKYKTLSIVKNVVNESGDYGYWQITTPKTKSSVRTIPIPDEVLSYLSQYFEEQKRMYGFTEKWFVFGDTTPLHPDRLRRKKNEYSQISHTKQIRIHDFRHSCASLLINNGASIIMVAKYLGHTKIDETLNTYSHLFKNKMEEIINTINNLNKIKYQ